MKKMIFALLGICALAACEENQKHVMCADYTLLEYNDFTARIITPNDRYFTLHRTEAECGYRYSVMIDNSPATLWDNCMGRWTLTIEQDQVLSCE